MYGARNSNQSSWGFEDFSAPEKPTSQGRPDGARNFSLGSGDDDTRAPPAAQRQVYKTSGDGMGGRRAPIEDDEPPVRNTRGSQNRRNDDDEEQSRQGNKGTVDQLGGEGRTIYRLHGDGMGGRKVAAEEEEAPVKQPRTMSAAKRAELGYRDDEVDLNKEVEQLAGGNRTIYRTQGDGMGGRKVVTEEEELPARAPRGTSAAKRAEMGYDGDEDLSQQMGRVELLGGGSKTIYRTQGDGMGGRKVPREEKPASTPRAFSAAKRAEMGYDYDEVEPKKGAELLGGGGRTIYKTQGDGMGGRKVVVEEEEPRAQTRGISAAKRAELGYHDDDIEEKSTKEVEQLGGGSKTIYRTQGDGMGGRRVVADEAPVASRTISAAKKAEMHREEEKPSGKVEQLAGGSRTIYKTSGDGMGGRRGASSSIFGFEEEEPVEQPRRGVRKDNHNQPSSHWDF